MISESDEIKLELEQEEPSHLSEPHNSEGSQENAGKKWTQTENIKFALFMHFYENIFNRKRERQAFRIFKKLSLFLGSRTPRQCRCHFQKLINRFKTPLRIRKFFKNAIGHKQYEIQFQTISKILQPLSLDYKIKNRDKLADKKDYSMQVDLDGEGGEQNYWWVGFQEYKIPACLYFQQQMIEYPQVCVYPLENYQPVKKE